MASLLSNIETIDGVDWSPIEFGIICTFPFLKTPIFKYDVPKSIPAANIFSNYQYFKYQKV